MKQILKWRWLLYLSVIVATARAQYKLPDGEGRAVVERMCSKCHTLEEVARTRRTEEQWAEVIDAMMSRGAQGTDSEIQQVFQYLVKNLLKEKLPAASPKINVNKASAKEISIVLGFSTADAEAIVGYREKKGNFAELQSLKKVPGIDVKKVDDNKDRLEF